MILTTNSADDVYLNVRTDSPSTGAYVKTTLPAGTDVDIVDVVPGTPIEGCDIWYKCVDGHFYWSRGFSVPPQGFVAKNYTEKKIEFLSDQSQAFLHNNSADETKWKVSWGHVDLEIWKIWRDHKTMGEGVKVAVLDFGIPNNNPDLPINTIKTYYSLGDGGNYIDDSDGFHGSMCAGMIAANGNKNVFGIAPRCELLVARVYDKTGTFSYQALIDSLIWARNNGADIISLSFSTDIDPTDPIQKKQIDNTRIELANCLKQKITIVCAIGDNGQLGPDELVFPACEDQCFAIGGYIKGQLARDPTTTPSKKLKFLLPDNSILTTNDTTAYFVDGLTSIATPFMAGILSLYSSLIKSEKIKITLAQILQSLYTSGQPVTEQIGTDTYNYVIPKPNTQLNRS